MLFLVISFNPAQKGTKTTLNIECGLQYLIYNTLYSLFSQAMAIYNNLRTDQSVPQIEETRSDLDDITRTVTMEANSIIGSSGSDSKNAKK